MGAVTLKNIYFHMKQILIFKNVYFWVSNPVQESKQDGDCNE